MSALFLWLSFGRPSRAEVVERDQYATFAGIPVDIGLLVEATGGPDGPLAKVWLDEIRALAEQRLREPSPYRDEGARLVGLVHDGDWKQLASLSSSLAPEARAAALTLARVAMTTSEREPVRLEATGAHAALLAEAQRAP